MEPNTPRAVVKEFKQSSLFCRKNTIKNLYGAEKKMKSYLQVSTKLPTKSTSSVEKNVNYYQVITLTRH